MVNSRLAYFFDRRPKRVFVVGDFCDAVQEVSILQAMPDYANFCEKRLDIRNKLDTVVPELRVFYQEPLLTREQEYHLFRQFNYLKFKFIVALDAEAIFQDNGKVSYSVEIPLDTDMSLLEDYYTRFTKIRQQVASCNTRLVINIAKKQKEFWEGLNLDLLVEFVGEGNIGLMTAIDYFDFRRGFKFSTYAHWAILETIVKSKKVKQRHDKTTLTGCSEDMFSRIIDNDRSEEPELNERNRMVRQVVDCLELRYQQVLNWYFEKGRSLDSIATELGLSKERVRQIRDKALWAIKNRLEELNVQEC
jgi:RNA polymerase sigma factor (sigma-70 family)